MQKTSVKLSTTNSKVCETNGLILYRGKSRIDGLPVVSIVTGLINRSENIKTGPMLQNWIFVDNGLSPFQNSMRGFDVSVCGDCKHRPYTKDGKHRLGSCYVRLDQGPHAIFKSLMQEKYPVCGADHLELFRGEDFRFGSFGNPSVIPMKIWSPILARLRNWTAYDHLWRLKKNQRYKQFCMASVDSVTEKQWANSLGWRTFRTKLPEEPVLTDEVVCPASEEGGRKSTCSQCHLCKGGGVVAKNVVINIHGVSYKVQRFRELKVISG